MSSNSNRARSASPNTDDDPDLALAIALSLQQEQPSASNKAEIASAQAQSIKPPNGVAFGSFALDRKKMEEERLARLGKRSADQAGLDSDAHKAKAQRPGAFNGDKVGPSSTIAQAKQSTKLPFPKGVFKRTWAYGVPRTDEDIKVEEVLQKDKLQLAVLSSFQWDEEWLLSKVDCSRTKTILVAYAANDAEVRVADIWNLRLTFVSLMSVTIADCQSNRKLRFGQTSHLGS